MKACPNCGMPGAHMIDRYIYIQCPKCLMCGPMMNGGQHNQHSDSIDHENAIKAWDKLPRR